MANKKLKAYRILPDNLYIERKADRQLLSILEEMESPGYVLVARQMGKTNMLLHARNKYETPSDVYVYIDLSNVFETSKECFRNIIDKAIETNLPKIGMLQEQIAAKRNKQNIAAHLEHVQELRLILNSINGKVVVILDEIDALIKTNYSDEIFKQIRSAYFEGRSNYSEFKRLTYFLSGVVDPKEIIKDPRISPFNIGQKIFLDDFSRVEVDQFVSKSELSLSDTVINKIFFWTKGNPRILYDVCSEIENTDSDLINESFIDTLIAQLYLTYFDKPPVDHIRELVEFDADLRKAIFSIHNDKTEIISNETKNKLYLAGIISSDFNREKLKLKNPIISESLNLKWLEQIERKKRSLVDIAFDFYKEKNFEKSITFFEEYLQHNATNTLGDAAIHILAICYFNIRKYDQAISYFNQINYDKKGFASSYYEVRYFIGYALYQLKKYDEAIKYLEELSEHDSNEEFYYDGLATLGGAYINSNFESNKYKFFDTNKALIERLNKKIRGQHHSNYYQLALCTAYYNEAAAYILSNEFTVAIEYLDMAASHCTNALKPAILFRKYALLESLIEKRKILEHIIYYITQNNLRPTVQPLSDIDFSVAVSNGILLESLVNDIPSFFELLDYLTTTEIFGANVKQDEILSLIGHYYLREGKRDNAFKAFQKLVDTYLNRNLPIFLDASRILLINPDRGLQPELFELYNNGVLKSDKVLDNYDQQIYAIYISQLIDQQNFTRANSLISIALSRKVVESSTFNKVIFYYYRLCIQHMHNDLEEGIQTAIAIRKYLKENVDFKKPTIFVKAELSKSIQVLVNQTIKNYDLQKNLSSNKTKEYGPNERVTVRYLNGVVKSSVKFKTIKEDYANGKCIIM